MRFFYPNHVSASVKTLILFLFVSQITFAQVFTGIQKKIQSSNLDKEFTQYEVYEFDLNAFVQSSKSQGNQPAFLLQLGTHNWDLSLQPSQIFADNYQLQTVLENGDKIISTEIPMIAFKGYDKNSNAEARFVIDENYLSGMIVETDDTYYIEALSRFVKDASPNQFVVYGHKSVKQSDKDGCIAKETGEFREKNKNANELEFDNTASKGASACYQLQLAIASDRTMFTKYATVAAVQAHNVTVINNVQVNYTGQFNHDLQYVITTNLVFQGTDPFTTSLSAGTLLDDFTAWGSGGGFGAVQFDLGELWTNRDFTGGTIGIAWVGALCSNFKYHALQDFTSNQDNLRCMTSHEIGHNLDCDHDATCPPNTIMCPFVSTSNSWSNLSKNQVNSYIVPFLNSSCLAACGGGGGGTNPTAAFIASQNTVCTGQSITFTDQSTGGTVTSRNWTFQNGTPATSTAANPTVSWSTPGIYNVTLTVNGGSSSTQQVNINGPAVPNFTSIADGLTISLNNTTTNASGASYLWNFGDGGTSMQTNPSHTYATSGTYTVTLSVTTSCGSTSTNRQITTGPVINFTANTTTVCQGTQVQFSELCTNDVTGFLWSFQGASPSVSTDANPLITYNQIGTFYVSLQGTSQNGTSTFTKQNYITVTPAVTANFTFSVIGTDVFFTNSSTNGTSYAWNFGDGGSSSQANPNHSYGTGGTYQVTLTTFGSCGSVSVTKTVVLGSAPVATFSASPVSGCAPLSVQYTNQTTGTGNTYNWTFPGGTPSSSTQANPVVVYQNSGVFNVSMQATNNIGNNTSTKNNYINVNSAPTANFTSITNVGSVNFTNTSSGATSYIWNFGDGQTSTEANPNHIYATNGSYSVVMTATNACGTTTSTQTVAVLYPPIANFQSNPTASNGCAPLNVQFSSTSTGSISSYNWSFPGGTPAVSNQANPSVQYLAAGTYSVSLTVSNASGNNTFSQNNIVVNSTPNPAFTSVSSGLSATFTNNSTNANSYLWDFGDGNSSNSANPSYNYATDGTYSVTLTAFNACGSTVSSQNIIIQTAPTPNFGANVQVGCTPLTVQFSNTSSANATQYSWSFPGGTPSTSTQQNPVVQYLTAGNYNVSLTASNGAGSNVISKADFISAGFGPSATFSATSNGFLASFTNTSVGANSYQWNFGDGGTSTLTTPQHTYSNDGTYTVTMTAFNACGSTTETQTVTILTPPIANFSVAQTVGCTPFAVQFTNASSSNATQYSWSFPGGTPASSTVANPSVIYNSTGLYSISLTVSNGAGNNTVIKSDFISIGTAPQTAFTSVNNGFLATFTNNSTGANSYLWSFGDGSNSTSANPSHTYQTDGTYVVTLAASNACGTTTSTSTLVIVTPPTAGFTSSGIFGCAPFTVQFNNTSSSNATQYNWTFVGGVPSTSTEQNPTVVYNNTGVFSAVLTVSNAAGINTISSNNNIQVNGLPTSIFETNTTLANVVLTNNSTNATSYLWDFGDGTSSTAQNTSHFYSSDGIYEIKLTTTNGCGSVVSTKTITIITPPTAEFTSAQTLGCSPFSVQFNNASSSNATSWYWEFDGGSPATSTAQNPTVIYNNTGNFGVKLTVSNAAGTDEVLKNNLITVTTVPQTSFNVQSNNNGLVAFNNTSQNASTYFWDFGDGSTANTVDATHTYSSDGIFLVTLTATNNCGQSTINQSITIVTPPVAVFNVSSTSGCAPLALTMNNSSSSNATAYSWVFDGGIPATSTEQNPSVVWNTPGIYTIKLTVSNAAGTSELIQGIEVIGLPEAQFTTNTAGLSVVCTNNSTSADTYLWDFGNGNTSTEANPSFDFGTTGTFTVVLTATNECGSNSKSQVVVISGSAPFPAIGIPNQVGCVPFVVNFADASFGNPTSWEWTFEGGTPATSNLQNPTITYNAIGSYDISLKTSNIFGSSDLMIQNYITVETNPTSQFNFTLSDFEVDFENISDNGTNYNWDFGDGNISNEINPTHVYTENGEYTVTLVTTNSCGASSLQKLIQIMVIGTDENPEFQQFKVFPNPNKGSFSVVIDGVPSNAIDFELYNSIGQSLGKRSFDFNSGSLRESLDFGALPAAVYMLKVGQNGKVSYQKIVVE
jgi:PKD repeat protein